MRSRVAVLAALAGFLIPLAACGKDVAPAGSTKAPVAAGAWREVADPALTDAQKAQRARADEARQALFGFLMKRLQEVMGASGPTAAITVCKTEAGRIAADVSRSKGVAIGRTSFKLRNPANQPPAWAQPYVAARRATPAVLAHDDGRLAVLHPIRLMATCLACHGDETAVAPDVREVLAREYPADQATGFKENDLRGWFWIEVPK